MNDVFGFITVILVFGIIFGYAAFMRYMGYKETLALAEKGLVRPERPQAIKNGKGALRWGIIITGLGLALFLGLLPIGMTDVGMDFPLGLGPWLLAGLIPIFFGLSLVLIYVLTRKEDAGGKKTDKE